MPRGLADRAPYVRDHLEGPRDLGVRRAGVPAGRAERGGRATPKDGRRWSRCASTRCAPAAGIPTARVADMDLAGDLGVGQLPVARSPGSAGAVYSRLLGSASSAWPACGRGTTGSSRSGVAPHPDRFVPLGITYLADPSWRRPRSGATPSGVHGGVAARAAAPPRLPVAALGLVGPGARGLRRDRHGGLPARRQLRDDGHGARRSAGRARRRRCSRRCRCTRVRRLAVVGRAPLRFPDLRSP